MSSRKCTLLLLGMLAVGGHQANAQSLFKDLGEKPGIDRLVTRAITIWTADTRIAPTFDDTNLSRLKRTLVEQICSLSGGDCTYTGRSMAEAHKGLRLANVHFNALAEDLQTAMEREGYPYSVQNRLLALLAPMQRDVVTR